MFRSLLMLNRLKSCEAFFKFTEGIGCQSSGVMGQTVVAFEELLMQLKLTLLMQVPRMRGLPLGVCRRYDAGWI